MLRTIIDFWDKRIGKELTLDHRPVDAKILPCVQEELAKIREKANKKLAKKFVFTGVQQGHQDMMKQCFWLNIINFMTLFRLAEIKLMKPSVLKQLNNFHMWCGFMQKNTIEISGVKLS